MSTTEKLSRLATIDRLTAAKIAAADLRLALSRIAAAKGVR